MKRIYFVGIYICLVTTNIGHAAFLNNFRENIRKTMYEVPKKSGILLNKESLQEKIHACRRDESRWLVMKASRGPDRLHLFSSFQGGDMNSLSVFFDNKPLKKNINWMDNHLRVATDLVQPWSGDYWAIRKGMAAKRYLDLSFIALSSWRESRDYVTAHPSASSDFDLHSPAEKYDRLVGDESFTLTEANWREGEYYNSESGDVENWMGLCHGWAPASYMEPRPSRLVEAQGYLGGNKIKMLPDDIKALLTLKWANAIAVAQNGSWDATRYIGGRCNVKDPQTDPETGRVIDPQCFDLNPGLWHLVVVNRLGVARRPLIIDAAFDFEVWNQPVFSYSYRYFNPKTLDETEELSQARVKFSDKDFKDKFSAFRNNPRAIEVVGVVMDVSYTVETSPTGRKTDSSLNDLSQTVSYYYDLELDVQGNVIGGEWYQARHPDFVWTPTDNSMALNKVDLSVHSERDVIAIAPFASRSAQPLKFVLDRLNNVSEARE